MNIYLYAITFIFYISVLSGCSSGNSNKPEEDVFVLSVTGQTTRYASGDDGDLQKGEPWPNPRFTVSNGTVLDNASGLMWLQDASMPLVAACGGGTVLSWQGALDYVSCLNTENYLGYTDWRLSNTNELRSLVNYSQADSSVWLNTQGFINVQGDVAKAFSYWASESRIDSPQSATIFGMGSVSGFINSGFKAAAMLYAWPVRLDSSLAQTGQASCYHEDGIAIDCAGTGQDGDNQPGIAWPSPRYAVGTGAEADCVTDTLSGLVWPRNHDSTLRSWTDALSYAQGLSLCGFTDWRLPNINELSSLTHTGKDDPASWLMTQGFASMTNGDFWSSTTFANNTLLAWVASLRGNFDVYTKTSMSSVRTMPVRGN